MISIIPLTLGIIEIYSFKPTPIFLTALLNKNGFIQLDINFLPEIKQTNAT